MNTSSVVPPWEEVDEASFLFDGQTHYILMGPDLIRWNLYSAEWAEVVFARDKRDRAAIRRFVYVFLLHIETGKRLEDGRQFSLLSQNTIATELGCSKATAQKMIARVTLTREYEHLRSQHSPLVERVRETLDGARAGLWGCGYAPILPDSSASEPGTVSPSGKCPGTPPQGDAVPGPEHTGTASPIPGTVSAQPGTVSPEKTVLSLSSRVSGDLSEDVMLEEYRKLIALFPMSPGPKGEETWQSYLGLIASGYTASMLYDGASRHLAATSGRERSRFPLRFLSSPDLVKAWSGPPRRHFSPDRLQKVGRRWVYCFDATNGLEYVDCADDASREEALSAARKEAERRGMIV